VIHVLTTGGTIDKVYFDATSNYQVGEPQVAGILREANVTCEYQIESLLRKDSLELTESDRELVRDRVLASHHTKILITHGTDTMIQTALMLRDIPGKTIVLTGAIQPGYFRNTDAAFNTGVAIGAVQCLPPGVYVTLNGQVLDPGQARKNTELRRIERIGGSKP